MQVHFSGRICNLSGLPKDCEAGYLCKWHTTDGASGQTNGMPVHEGKVQWESPFSFYCQDPEDVKMNTFMTFEIFEKTKMEKFPRRVTTLQLQLLPYSQHHHAQQLLFPCCIAHWQCNLQVHIAAVFSTSPCSLNPRQSCEVGPERLMDAYRASVLPICQLEASESMERQAIALESNLSRRELECFHHCTTWEYMIRAQVAEGVQMAWQALWSQEQQARLQVHMKELLREEMEHRHGLIQQWDTSWCNLLSSLLHVAIHVSLLEEEAVNRCWMQEHEMEEWLALQRKCFTGQGNGFKRQDQKQCRQCQCLSQVTAHSIKQQAGGVLGQRNLGRRWSVQLPHLVSSADLIAPLQKTFNADRSFNQQPLAAQPNGTNSIFRQIDSGNWPLPSLSSSTPAAYLESQSPGYPRTASISSLTLSITAHSLTVPNSPLTSPIFPPSPQIAPGQFCVTSYAKDDLPLGLSHSEAASPNLFAPFPFPCDGACQRISVVSPSGEGFVDQIPGRTASVWERTSSVSSLTLSVTSCGDELSNPASPLGNPLVSVLRIQTPDDSVPPSLFTMPMVDADPSLQRWQSANSSVAGRASWPHPPPLEPSSLMHPRTASISSFTFTMTPPTIATPDSNAASPRFPFSLPSSPGLKPPAWSFDDLPPLHPLSRSARTSPVTPRLAGYHPNRWKTWRRKRSSTSIPGPSVMAVHPKQPTSPQWEHTSSVSSLTLSMTSCCATVSAPNSPTRSYEQLRPHLDDLIDIPYLESPVPPAIPLSDLSLPTPSPQKPNHTSCGITPDPFPISRQDRATSPDLPDALPTQKSLEVKSTQTMWDSDHQLSTHHDPIHQTIESLSPGLHYQAEDRFSVSLALAPRSLPLRAEVSTPDAMGIEYSTKIEGFTALPTHQHSAAVPEMTGCEFQPISSSPWDVGPDADSELSPSLPASWPPSSGINYESELLSPRRNAPVPKFSEDNPLHLAYEAQGQDIPLAGHPEGTMVRDSSLQVPSSDGAFGRNCAIFSEYDAMPAEPGVQSVGPMFMDGENPITLNSQPPLQSAGCAVALAGECAIPGGLTELHRIRDACIDEIPSFKVHVQALEAHPPINPLSRAVLNSPHTSNSPINPLSDECYSASSISSPHTSAISHHGVPWLEASASDVPMLLGAAKEMALATAAVLMEANTKLCDTSSSIPTSPMISSSLSVAGRSRSLSRPLHLSTMDASSTELACSVLSKARPHGVSYSKAQKRTNSTKDQSKTVWKTSSSHMPEPVALFRFENASLSTSVCQTTIAAHHHAALNAKRSLLNPPNACCNLPDRYFASRQERKREMKGRSQGRHRCSHSLDCEDHG